MRWLTNFYDFSFKWIATAGIGIHPTKAWFSQLVNLKNAIWTWGHFRRTICNKIVLNLEKMPHKHMECFRLLFDHLAWIEHQFLSGIRDLRKAESLWGMMRGVGGVRKSIHQSWLVKGLGLICWGFKGIKEEIPSEEASTLQSGQWHFHQDNAPVHNSILVTDYLTKIGIKTVPQPPTVQTLLPVTFGYFLSTQAVVMRQLRRWKRLWRRSLTRSHKRTSMGPSRSCWNSTSALLWRGLEFHVCTINKSAHTKKVWKLI